MRIPLKRLSKRVGGRLRNVETYTAFCTRNCQATPTAWLQAQRTLKHAADSHEFVHVANAVMNGLEVVVKLCDASALSTSKEITALYTLRGVQNVATFICEFPCTGLKLNWNEDVPSGTSFCEGGDDGFRVIVVEYLKAGDVSRYFSEHREISDSDVSDFLKQGICALLVMFFTHNIVHGDMHCGNILVDVDPEPSISYNIPSIGLDITIDTRGMSPVFVDFGLSMNPKPAVCNDPDNFYMVNDMIILFMESVASCLPKPIQTKIKDLYMSLHDANCITYIELLQKPVM
jgi:serine/threonine protein kinase